MYQRPGDTNLFVSFCSSQATGTFDAIAEYQSAGGAFAVCTGRDLASARGVLKGLDIDRMPGATTKKNKTDTALRLKVCISMAQR